MKNYFCPACNEKTSTKIEKRQESFNIKGQNITMESEIRVCAKCGEEILDEKLDNENLKRFYNEYRKNNGLLMPEEIKEIRQRYDISQSAFAKILGLGEKTITRYENGSLQDMAQNNLILLMKNKSNFIRLWEKNKFLLQESEREKTENRLKKMSSKNKNQTIKFPQNLKVDYSYKMRSDYGFFGAKFAIMG